MIPASIVLVIDGESVEYRRSQTLEGWWEFDAPDGRGVFDIDPLLDPQAVMLEEIAFLRSVVSSLDK